MVPPAPVPPPVGAPEEIVASPPLPKGDKPPTDWGFLWRPGWIFSHLFVLACVVAFIFLGLWQLSRLHGRRQINHMLAARMESPAVPIQSLVTAHESRDLANKKDYRQVTVTGRYDNARQILIANEQDDNPNPNPGFWLVTPMKLSDGSAVMINRGFIPLDINENGPLTQFAPPPGTVTVTGLVYPTQRRTGGPYDPATGRLRRMARVDLERMQRQLPYKIYPVYVDLQTSKPPQRGQYPQPVPRPVLNDGPHLNYAGQWFIFATLTVIVYPLLLRRTARNRAAGEADPAIPVDAAPCERPRGSGRADERARPVDQPDVRTRILEATLACVERRGLAKTSLEDVATEAGVSRATVYRHFAGGREQLISDTVAWEVLRFLVRLAEVMEPEPDLQAKLARGIVFGHQAIHDHMLLQRVLLSEPELLLTEFHTSLPGFIDLVRDYMVGLLADVTFREGVDRADAADYLSHLFLSYVGSHGRWDLADDRAVADLVRTQFLAGIVA